MKSLWVAIADSAVGSSFGSVPVVIAMQGMFAFWAAKKPEAESSNTRHFSGG